MQIRPYLLTAAGFALGVATAAVACRPEPAARPPLVEPLGGSYKGAKLRAVNVRTGDTIRRVGEPVDGELIHVYLEVSGVPVALSLDPAR